MKCHHVIMFERKAEYRYMRKWASTVYVVPPHDDYHCFCSKNIKDDIYLKNEKKWKTAFYMCSTGTCNHSSGSVAVKKKPSIRKVVCLPESVQNKIPLYKHFRYKQCACRHHNWNVAVSFNFWNTATISPEFYPIK